MSKRIALAALLFAPLVAFAATGTGATDNKTAADAKRAAAPAATRPAAKSVAKSGTKPGVKKPAAERHTFKSMDRDADGKLSREEAGTSPKLAARFEKADRNHDGFLTREELKPARTAKRTSSKAAA